MQPLRRPFCSRAAGVLKRKGGTVAIARTAARGGRGARTRSASTNLELASTHLPAISTALDREAKDLPGLVLQTQTSMRELERLLAALQRHWLLRKYVNPTNPPPLRPVLWGEPPAQKPAKVLRSPKDAGR